MTREASGLDRKQAQIPAPHALGCGPRHASLNERAREPVTQREAAAVAEADHGHQVLLRVELQRVVDATVEVNGEVRNPQHQVVETDQARVDAGALACERDTTCDRQVAIEPGAVERAAVDLDRKLTIYD